MPAQGNRQTNSCDDVSEKLVKTVNEPGRGALFDEAYEFYCDPEPKNALCHIDDIDHTDIFVVDGTTEGLQVPGMRGGWADSC